eukprot:360973-Chlamydomonas_euryale.AAC.5
MRLVARAWQALLWVGAAHDAGLQLLSPFFTSFHLPNTTCTTCVMAARSTARLGYNLRNILLAQAMSYARARLFAGGTVFVPWPSYSTHATCSLPHHAKRRGCASPCSPCVALFVLPCCASCFVSSLGVPPSGMECRKARASRCRPRVTAPALRRLHRSPAASIS